MAIAFPNFLGTTYKPDYSGIGDALQNYYAGRAMPNDDLIKRIQAQFAEPNAKQNLINAKLTAQQLALQNQKSRYEMQQELALQKMLQQAMNPGATMPSMPQPAAMSNALAVGAPANAGANQDNSAASAASMANGVDPYQGFDRSKMDKRFLKYEPVENGSDLPVFNQNGMTPANNRMNQIAPLLANIMKPQQAQSSPAPMLAPPAAPITINGAAVPQTSALMQPAQTAPNETIVSPGSPNLYGIDAAFDNPLLRQYLEKKGFKKTVQTKIDNKTGIAREITTYPSGKSILRTIRPENSADPMNGDIPLTKPILTAAIKQVRGTDAVIPYLDQLIEMGGAKLDKNGDLVTDKNGKVVFDDNQLPWINHGILAYGNANSAYDRIVNNALEKYMAASGFQQTDKSTEKVEKIMNRGTWEGHDAYVKQLAKERKNMLEGRKQNVQMITKGLKRFPDFGSESNTGSTSPSYSSDEWEQTDGQ